MTLCFLLFLWFLLRSWWLLIWIYFYVFSFSSFFCSFLFLLVVWCWCWGWSLFPCSLCSFCFLQAGVALYDCAGLSCRPAGSGCHLVWGLICHLAGCWSFLLVVGSSCLLAGGECCHLAGIESCHLAVVESCHLAGVRAATWQGWELLPLGRGWELPLGRDWELPLGRGQCLLIGRDCLVVLVLSVSLNSGLYVIVMDAPNDTCFAFWDLRHFILFYWRLVLDSMVQSADCSSSS